MSHTDKHWSVDGHNLTAVIEKTETGWNKIHYCGDCEHNKESIEVCKSNAQLIAAAPDMLRLLYKIKDNISDFTLEKEIESTINKAEGNPLQVINLTSYK